MINAAKNKCSDVSIFKGKARNVDYMSSCKLRVLEKKVLLLFFFVLILSVYKYVGTGEAMAASVPCTNSIQLSGFFFSQKKKKSFKPPLPLQLAYISAYCTFA